MYLLPSMEREDLILNHWTTGTGTGTDTDTDATATRSLRFVWRISHVEGSQELKHLALATLGAVVSYQVDWEEVKVLRGDCERPEWCQALAYSNYE